MLNKILIFFICLSLYATQLYAGPASPDLIEVTQPDGSSFKIRKQGDEFQNWTETETGYTVLKNKKTKEWEYAVKIPDGSLGLSGQKVSPQQKSPSNIPQHLKPLRNNEAEKIQSQVLQDIYLQRSSSKTSTSTTTQDSAISYATGDWTPLPVSGTRKILVIMVNFSDRSLTTTPDGWSSAVFSTTAGVKSVANYYKDNSFNTLSVIPVTHTQSGSPSGVVTVSVDYVHPDNGTAESTWVAAAINTAASYVNFASLDTNENGYIDRTEAVVYLIPAGYEESGSSKTPSVWAHATSYYSGGLSAAGKLFPAYAMNGELNDSDVQHPIGVIAHEMGHQFCGLPDLYDTSSQNQGLGNFSLMASGSWGANIGEYSGATPTNLDIWSREYLGWATPQVPSTSGTLSLAHPLSAQNAAYKFISPSVNTTEYYLVENRQPIGWDLGLRGKTGFGSGWVGGLLITHIDITAGTVGNNDINKYTANAGRQGVIPVQASTAACDMLSVGASCRGNATTLYYSANNTSWGPSTTPNSNYYGGAATNFSLTGISAPAATMTGTISFTPPVTKTLTVSKNGAGSGTVSSSPAGISCGSTCSASFLQNETITLTAVGDASSVFTGWSGGCSGTGTCAVSLTNDTTVTATFTTATTLINENFDGVTYPALPTGWSSSVITNGGAWAIHAGTIHPIGIAAHSPSNLVYFNSWTVASGDAAALVSPAFSLSGSSSNTASFWMYRDSAYSDSADKVEVYINTSNSLTNAMLLGTVNRSIGLAPVVANEGWYNYSFSIPETFTGASNYLIIKGISGYGNDIHLDDISVLGVASNKTLTVLFPGTGSGSIISTSGLNPALNCSAPPCSASLAAGASVTLQRSSTSLGSTFAGWSGCNSQNGDNCSLTMTADKTASATFTLLQYLKNMGSGNYYGTLRSALDAAAPGQTIRALAIQMLDPAGVNFNTSTLGVIVKGGFSTLSDTSPTGYTSVTSPLQISSGSLTVENLVIK